MSKLFIIVLIVCLIFIGGVFFFSGQNDVNTNISEQQYSEIVLVLINNYQPDSLLQIKEKLQETFTGVTVKIDSETLFLPDELFEEDRQQYNSKNVLEFIHGQYFDRPSTQIVVGVLEEEIYSGNLNFAFSSADKVNKVGVISTAFFGREIQMPQTRDGNFDFTSYAEKTISDRSHKTALRMIGGMVGLSSGFFQSSDCAMSFSNTLSELDDKGTEWCGENEQILKSTGLI